MGGLSLRFFCRYWTIACSSWYSFWIFSNCSCKFLILFSLSSRSYLIFSLSLSRALSFLLISLIYFSCSFIISDLSCNFSFCFSIFSWKSLLLLFSLLISISRSVIFDSNLVICLFCSVVCISKPVIWLLLVSFNWTDDDIMVFLSYNSPFRDYTLQVNYVIIFSFWNLRSDSSRLSDLIWSVSFKNLDKSCSNLLILLVWSL